MIDLTGQKFGRLLVLERQGSNKSRAALWRCECECGNQRVVVTHQLNSGKTRSCGCLANDLSSERLTKDMVGQKCGRLTVISRGENDPCGRAQWNRICECGNTKLVRGYSLRSGKTVSCGCYVREMERPFYRGRYTKHPLGDTWRGMIDRCTNPKHAMAHRYTERGITVCEEWLNDPWAFIRYVEENLGPKPTPEHTLDRYPDNDGNYEPNNIRWASRSEQMYNTERSIQKRQEVV